MIALLLVALICWRPENSSWQAMWTEKWGLVVGAFLLLGLQRLPWRRWIYGLTLGYFVVMALLSAYLGGYRTDIPKEMVSVLRQASLEQLLALGAFAVAVSRVECLDPPMFRWPVSSWSIRKWTALLVAILIAASPHPSIEVLALHNPSMAATFVVLASSCTPWALVAVLMTKSWAAGGSLLLGLAWRHRDNWRIMAAIEVVARIAVVVVIRKGFPDHGRLRFAADFFEIWQSAGWRAVVFGLGPGTTRVYLPLASAILHPANTSVWLHNDWLQWAGELGLVGGSLAAWSAILLWRDTSEEDRPLFLAYAASMLMNFPTHWPLTALVGWALVARNALEARQVIDENIELTGAEGMDSDQDLRSECAGRP
jgi:hypothetical protein